MDAKPDLMDDLQRLCLQHLGKIVVAGAVSIGSATSAGLAWFATEYRDTELLGATTAEKLDAHAQLERENYQSLMEVLDHLQTTTGEIRSDMAVIKYRLNAAQGINAAHYATVTDDDGMQ